jgi:hypothetical protein
VAGHEHGGVVVATAFPIVNCPISSTGTIKNKRIFGENVKTMVTEGSHAIVGNHLGNERGGEKEQGHWVKHCVIEKSGEVK